MARESFSSRSVGQNALFVDAWITGTADFFRFLVPVGVPSRLFFHVSTHNMFIQISSSVEALCTQTASNTLARAINIVPVVGGVVNFTSISVRR